MNVTFGYNGTIDYIRFSEVFINIGDYSVNSNKYLIFNEWVNPANASNFYPYNNVLTRNFMMGLKSFKANSGQCALEYQWQNTYSNGIHGAQISSSLPVNNSHCGLTEITNTILFFITWSCPHPYIYFNIATSLCQTGCDPYNYANSTDLYCYPCNNTVCYGCH
jgi:hypothetical protein